MVVRWFSLLSVAIVCVPSALAETDVPVPRAVSAPEDSRHLTTRGRLRPCARRSTPRGHWLLS
jgi:hypothetical protein